MNPPCPCVGPPTDQKERWEQSGHCFGLDCEAEGKQEASAGTPWEDFGWWREEGTFSVL